MSLMNNRNKKGPGVDPWGTPALTVFHLEKYPSIFTLCFLLYRNLSIHFRTFPQIPYFRSLKIKPECQTRSNAFEMSQNINRTSLPRSRFFYNSIIYY